jgi:hypothetical protein
MRHSPKDLGYETEFRHNGMSLFCTKWGLEWIRGCPCDQETSIDFKLSPSSNFGLMAEWQRVKDVPVEEAKLGVRAVYSVTVKRSRDAVEIRAFDADRNWWDIGWHDIELLTPESPQIPSNLETGRPFEIGDVVDEEDVKFPHRFVELLDSQGELVARVRVDGDDDKGRLRLLKLFAGLPGTLKSLKSVDAMLSKVVHRFLREETP